MRLDLHRSLCSFLGQHASRAEHNKYGIGSIQGPIMVQASVRHHASNYKIQSRNLFPSSVFLTKFVLI